MLKNSKQLHRKNLLLEESPKASEGSDWIYTYSDIMTLLLCFFILFFNIDKSKVMPSLSVYFENIKNKDGTFTTKSVATPATSKSEAATVATSTSVTSSAIEEVPAKKNAKLSLKSLEMTGLIQVSEDVNTLTIKFKEGNFFDSSSLDVNQNGKDRLVEVAKLLTHLQDDFYINIIAFSDPRPIKANHTKLWKSNDELAVLRSLRAASFLQEKGIRKENVYATGIVPDNKAFAEFNGAVDIKKNPVENIDVNDFSSLRNIAIRLHLK